MSRRRNCKHQRQVVSPPVPAVCDAQGINLGAQVRRSASGRWCTWNHRLCAETGYRKTGPCIIHGLDLTYKNTIYQKLWVNIFIRHMDELIAVGHETIHQGVSRGIPKSNFVFVPNWGSPANPDERFTHHELETLIGKKIRPHSANSWRLVKRKGVVWFIDNVVSTLDENIVYIIAGAGKEEAHIYSAIQNNHLQDRIFFIGEVSDRDKKLLFSTADIFIFSPTSRSKETWSVLQSAGGRCSWPCCCRVKT